MRALARALDEVCRVSPAFVLVTLTRIRGSAPQEEGAKMIVTPEGRFWGTVGGGKIENHCIGYARELLATGGKSHACTWNLQTEIGMSCGGEVTLFFDVEPGSQWHVAVFGAGHISQSLCRILGGWACDLKVFDTRAEWLEKLPRSPNLAAKLSSDMPGEIAALPQGAYVLCMTQGHATDLPILDRAFSRHGEFAFIGVIGSDVKAGKLRRELESAGHAREAVAALACPLGLPLGNNTPEEIAVSIASQLLALRDKRSFRVEAGLPLA